MDSTIDGMVIYKQISHSGICQGVFCSKLTLDGFNGPVFTGRFRESVSYGELRKTWTVHLSVAWPLLVTSVI